MIKDTLVNISGEPFPVEIDMYPDECGICHKNVAPSYVAGAFVKGEANAMHLELVFQCTNNYCNSLMIGYYSRENSTPVYNYGKNAPVTPKKLEFSSEIEEVSNNFIEIYNQAFFAEQNELTLISGIGYRKAIEFLVKDYLRYLGEEDTEQISKLPLNQCINKLENEKIKNISKRAVWLGNDEAHYTRKWEDKDVEDLKKLIEVTVYFISMEVAGKKYLDDMN